MKRAIARTILLGALPCAALFLAAGCNSNKPSAAVPNSSERRGGESDAKTPTKTPLSVANLGPCKNPPIEPQKNEAGNYGEIYFGHYKIELQKAIVCDPKGTAFQEAKGQVYFGGNTDLLITSGQVSKSSERSVEVLVNKSPVVFAVTTQTEVCGKTINVGTIATITSHVKDNGGTALSLRSGALAWSLAGMGGPAHFNCKD